MSNEDSKPKNEPRAEPWDQESVSLCLKDVHYRRTGELDIRLGCCVRLKGHGGICCCQLTYAHHMDEVEHLAAEMEMWRTAFRGLRGVCRMYWIVELGQWCFEGVLNPMEDNILGRGKSEEDAVRAWYRQRKANERAAEEAGRDAGEAGCHGEGPSLHPDSPR